MLSGTDDRCRHKVPCLWQVRKTAAGKLFETVIMFDGLVSDENLEELNTLLSETQWSVFGSCDKWDIIIHLIIRRQECGCLDDCQCDVTL